MSDLYEGKSPLFIRAVTLMKFIPKGRVITYGQVADYIGAPGCARHISYILSSSSNKYKIPWHRILSSEGKIARHSHHRQQIKKLESESVNVEAYRVNLDQFLWKPKKTEVRQLLRGIPRHKSIYKTD
ncbi:MAG: MGMT family protein [Bdellovibrionales bacterium]|nr:MGMT family protein [Bdellovibrionales bacterium]NQZ19257.1 MGMT family protein [Bdellovibrionales bacterium]